MWGYLGLAGELALPALLGSHAENTASGLRVLPLAEGQEIPLVPRALSVSAVQAYVDPMLAWQDRPLGVLPSSQFSDFSQPARDRLVASALTIAPRFDRMAYQLAGIELACERGHDILSDGITQGAIQVPGSGRPFVLMADHQPTGGYPKIACICMADLPRLAQMTPGRAFSLRWVELSEAMLTWQQLRHQLDHPVALRGVE